MVRLLDRAFEFASGADQIPTFGGRNHAEGQRFGPHASQLRKRTFDRRNETAKVKRDQDRARKHDQTETEANKRTSIPHVSLVAPATIQEANPAPQATWKGVIAVGQSQLHAERAASRVDHAIHDFDLCQLNARR